MAYTKTEWKDQNVENPRTYSVRDNGDSTVTLMDAFGTVTELGTPVNAENMNKIENGIANAVDKDSNQTITGTKVFNGGIPIKLNKAGNTYTEIQYTSDGSTRLGGIRNIREGSSDIMQMYVASTDGSTRLGAIQLNRDDHNGILAAAPHPAASTNYNNPAIMTAGRAADPTQNFNLLHRSGDEIFNGVKTCQSDKPMFCFKNTLADISNKPSALTNSSLFFLDKNGLVTGEIRNAFSTTGYLETSIYTNSKTSGTTKTSYIKIVVNENGEVYATCPTPPRADDNSTKISNTQWVNRRITSIMDTSRPLNYASQTSVSFPLSTSKYTAPSQGVYMIYAKWAGRNGITCYVNNKPIGAGGNSQPGSAYVDTGSSAFIPLNTGDVLYFSDNCRQVFYAYFVPYAG